MKLFKGTRGQIKMGETIAVLVIFFFLLVFGMGFYVRVQAGTFEKQQRKIVSLKSIQVAQKASLLPELQCSFKNIQVDNCVDMIKVAAFDELVEQDPDRFQKGYYDLFEFSEITLKQIYPGDDEFTIYSNPKPDFQYRFSTDIPISLYNATAKQYGLGVMRVSVYG